MAEGNHPWEKRANATGEMGPPTVSLKPTLGILAKQENVITLTLEKKKKSNLPRTSIESEDPDFQGEGSDQL